MKTSRHPATETEAGTQDRADKRLLAEVGRGEPGAARAFVRRYQSHVYGLARTIVGDDLRAEEVSQHALSRASLHASTYDPGRRSVLAWVLGITRQLALQSLVLDPAPSVGRSSVDRSVDFPDVLDSATAPDRTDLGDERAAAVRTALSQLPVTQPRALVLAALWGHTAGEISEVEAIPVDEARIRIRSGLITMRNLLRHDGPQTPTVCREASLVPPF